MKLPDELQPPSPPIIDLPLPEAEEPAGLAVKMGLDAMESHAREFAAAVALLEFCKTQPLGRRLPQCDLFHLWKFTASRDAAIAIFNYGEALEGVRNVIGLCPTWMAEVKNDELREAFKRFDAEFEARFLMRHAVAHQSELWDHPAKLEQDREALDGGGFMILSGVLYGTTYHTTINGKTVSLDLTSERVETLNSITASFFHAFRKIDSRRRSTVKLGQ